MFDDSAVAISSIPSPPDAAPRQDRVRELQSRIRSMQSNRQVERTIPTPDAVGALLPDGGLVKGATYSLERSSLLVMALLAEPSRAGGWCGVVGLPDFGVEAAQHAGIALDRLVVVPDAGEQWLQVTAAIADIVEVVVVRPPAKASPSAIQRLSARLRTRGTTLLVQGHWPHSEAMLSLSGQQWNGIGAGHGRLSSREVTLTVTHRDRGRPRSARVLLPDLTVGLRGLTPPRSMPGARVDELRAVAG